MQTCKHAFLLFICLLFTFPTRSNAQTKHLLISKEQLLVSERNQINKFYTLSSNAISVDLSKDIFSVNISYNTIFRESSGPFTPSDAIVASTSSEVIEKDNGLTQADENFFNAAMIHKENLSNGPPLGHRENVLDQSGACPPDCNDIWIVRGPCLYRRQNYTDDQSSICQGDTGMPYCMYLIGANSRCESCTYQNMGSVEGGGLGDLACALFWDIRIYCCFQHEGR